MNFDSVLGLTPSHKLNEWREVVRSTLAAGKNIIWVADTETTGTEPFGDRNNRDLKDRLLEIAMIAYEGNGTLIKQPLKDKDGGKIYFHEYVNPFLDEEKHLIRYNSIREIPYEVLYVHGINLSFLQGKTGLLDSKLQQTSFKLPKPARPFHEIKPALEWLTCCDLSNELLGRNYILAHNCHFDVEFLDMEFIKAESLHEGRAAPAAFESFFAPLDTLKMIREMYSRDEIRAATPPDVLAKLEDLANNGTKVSIGFGLEFLRYFYRVDDIDRDVHGAMVDSEILAAVYSKMSQDQNWLNMPYVKNLNKAPLEHVDINENSLIKL